MNNEIWKIQKIDNVQEFQTLLKVHYPPCEPTKENLSLDQNTNSKRIKRRHDFIRKDNGHNYIFKINQLIFSSSELTQVPIEICQLKYLTVLNFNNNLLGSLPEDIGNLYNLVTLQLSGNKLNYLPKSLRHVQQLNCLDISHNDFVEVPEVLSYGLRMLKVLDLSHNKISTFSDPPVCKNELAVLNLCHNVLIQVPVWIFDNVCHLQILDISQNHMRLHSELVNFLGTGVFESLQVLNVENCNYSSENMQVSCEFKNLETLHLGNKTNSDKIKSHQNYFGNFTMNIFKNLTTVKHLHLQNVQLATLPLDFDCLKNIYTLDLSNNFLSWLPECFCNLTSLRTLHLTSNQLLLLPKNIGSLVNLQQIHLGNNKLYQIPESFYNLANLEFVDFYNNKIEKIDVKIFRGRNMKGIDLGLNYLDLFESDGDLDEIQDLYGCFKNSFRKAFGFLDCRSDMQMTSLHKTADGLSSDSRTSGSKYSSSSFESEQSSDNEDPPVRSSALSCRSGLEEEDWEKGPDQADKDESFDPNEASDCRPFQDLWNSKFQKNYCPAKYHAPSLKDTFMNNFKLALKKETIEGQFDSD